MKKIKHYQNKITIIYDRKGKFKNTTTINLDYKKKLRQEEKDQLVKDIIQHIKEKLEQ